MSQARPGSGCWYRGLDSWDRALKAVCGPFDTEPLEELSGPASFSGRIGVHRTAGLEVADLAIDPCRIVKTRRALGLSEDRHVFLILQRAGEARLYQNGRMAHLEPGDCALIDSRRESEFILAGGIQQLSCHLPWERLAEGLGVARAERLPFATVFKGETAAGRELSRYLIELVIRPPSAAGAEDALDGLLGALAGLVDARVPDQPRRAERLLAALDLYLERHLHDPDLDVERIARDNNLSRRSLYRLFAARGTTPLAWLWGLRLERARMMLADPRFSAWHLTDIALACGFRDHAHFTRRFKERFGHPPSLLRRAG
ncbi:MAG: transcriptional regulator FeaR [Rhodothalassiaceae bacterium]|nr:MAG: transcriptional regulator FeaR [Rhodothalassiaceae bacterium]